MLTGSRSRSFAAGLLLLTLGPGAFGEPPIPRSRIVLIPRDVVASLPREIVTQLAKFSPLGQFGLDKDNVVEAWLAPGSPGAHVVAESLANELQETAGDLASLPRATQTRLSELSAPLAADAAQPPAPPIPLPARLFVAACQRQQCGSDYDIHVASSGTTTLTVFCGEFGRLTLFTEGPVVVTSSANGATVSLP